MNKQWYTTGMNNAIEFISAYNEIDARLRALYKGKGNLQFSDLVRRCAEYNATVKRYEDELASYARLRNAIVHNSTKEKIIAEPCDDATREIRHIADLLSRPPQLKDLKRKELSFLSSDATLKEAFCAIAKSGFSNLPVYDGGRMLGVINNRRLVRELGKALMRGESADSFLSATCAEILRDEDMYVYYKLLSAESSVQEAIDAFGENKKLLAVIVTEHGAHGSEITNILTAADLPRLLKLLED